MTDKEALQAFARGERLAQPVVKRLWKAGLIEVTDVTNMGFYRTRITPNVHNTDGTTGHGELKAIYTPSNGSFI
jgi:hypothetical protein